MSSDYHNPYRQPTNIDYRLVLAARVAEFEAHCASLPELEIPEFIRVAAEASNREYAKKQGGQS